MNTWIVLGLLLCSVALVMYGRHLSRSGRSSDESIVSTVYYALGLGLFVVAVPVALVWGVA